MQEAKTKKDFYSYQQVREEWIPDVRSLITFSRAPLLQMTKPVLVNKSVREELACPGESHRHLHRLSCPTSDVLNQVGSSATPCVFSAADCSGVIKEIKLGS